MTEHYGLIISALCWPVYRQIRCCKIADFSATKLGTFTSKYRKICGIEMGQIPKVRSIAEEY